MDAKWYKLNDGTWGVKIRHDGQAGEEVTVTNRDGVSKQVTLNVREAKFDDAQIWSVSSINQDPSPSVRSGANRKIIRESGRPLGWEADRGLLREMSEQGYDPVDFRLTPRGLEIVFEQSKLDGPSEWVYDCNQEGGSAQTVADTFQQYRADFGSESGEVFEPIFAYRVQFEGANSQGTYVRFFGRCPRDFGAPTPVAWKITPVVVTSRGQSASPGPQWQKFAQFVDTWSNGSPTVVLFKQPVW